MKNKKLMILVITYNAEKTVASLLDRIPKEIWDKSSEVLLADDASRDNTAKVAEEYKKSHKKGNLTIIHHEKNKGYGGNQKFGYNYAIKKGYDMVVMLHGDVQYAPEDIPRLLVPLENDEADFVFGSRMTGHPLKGRMPLYKFFGNKFLTFTENLILGTRLSEFHSGFRLYNVHALAKIPFNECTNDFHFDSEIIAQLKLAKMRMKELTIQTYYGNEKCNVKVISYGLNIWKSLGQYVLHRLGIKKYKKYHITPSN